MPQPWVKYDAYKINVLLHFSSHMHTICIHGGFWQSPRDRINIVVLSACSSLRVQKSDELSKISRINCTKKKLKKSKKCWFYHDRWQHLVNEFLKVFLFVYFCQLSNMALAFQRCFSNLWQMKRLITYQELSTWSRISDILQKKCKQEEVIIVKVGSFSNFEQIILFMLCVVPHAGLQYNCV